MLAGKTPVLVHNCDISDGYLYRGLAEGHHSYEAATNGRATLMGGRGHSSIEDHVGADNTDSIFTSWSDDPEQSVYFAQNLGQKWTGKGVMMRIRVAEIDPLVGPSRNIQIHGGEFDQLEDEHLIVGEIMAHDISFDFGGTWRSVSGG
ncbi:hypothetical protein ACFWA6_03745 [Streptomyces sp. NPDC060020]|uniref:hypothetical protein n=1 Tax=Streptomyces sp. NPDC060020 TaxID=3347038 RepID=UPI0036CB6E80